MGCATPAVPWYTPLTKAHNLRCEAYTQCEKEPAEVVSCGDPAAGHEWQAQRIPAIPAGCVAPAQQQDLPKQVSVSPSIVIPKALGHGDGVAIFQSV